MKIVLGSQNPAKLEAAQHVVERLFPDVKVLGVKVPTGIDAQPKSDEETIEGAITRAQHARDHGDVDYGIGMEGGFHRIGDRYFESGWIAVVDRTERVGLGSSARWELSPTMARELLSGKELAEVINRLVGQEDVHKGIGAMGTITNGHLTRAQAYAHGLFFAFGPFISDKKYWE